MEIKAVARNVRMSPRKVRVLALVFKNTPVLDTLTRLVHVNRAASRPLMKLISSAVANAKNVHNLSPEQLQIKNITVDGATVLKRFRPAARGAAHSYKRRNSHITVVLEG